MCSIIVNCCDINKSLLLTYCCCIVNKLSTLHLNNKLLNLHDLNLMKYFFNYLYVDILITFYKLYSLISTPTVWSKRAAVVWRGDRCEVLDKRWSQNLYALLQHCFLIPNKVYTDSKTSRCRLWPPCIHSTPLRWLCT